MWNYLLLYAWVTYKSSDYSQVTKNQVIKDWESFINFEGKHIFPTIHPLIAGVTKKYLKLAKIRAEITIFLLEFSFTELTSWPVANIATRKILHTSPYTQYSSYTQNKKLVDSIHDTWALLFHPYSQSYKWHTHCGYWKLMRHATTHMYKPELCREVTAPVVIRACVAVSLPPGPSRCSAPYWLCYWPPASLTCPPPRWN